MKPTSKHLEAAVAELGAIPFFPSDAASQLVIARHLAKFVGGVAELRWLVDSAVTAMQRWGGIPELRGLYCTRYKPEDGIEANCSLAGYSPEDGEMAEALKIQHAVDLEMLGPGHPIAADLKQLVEAKRLK